MHAPTSALLAILAAAVLAGCVSTSQSTVVSPLSQAMAQSGRVDEVVFDGGGLDGVSSEFTETFKTNVKAKLAACAKGDKQLRLEASISKVTKANKAMVIVLGAGRSSVAGRARLVDISTGATVGEYDIGRKVYGARPAMIVMLQGEKQLSNAFGDELCARAFPKAT